MLRLAAEAGLRRAEVALVRTSDVFITGGTAQLVVHGKGGKQRIVPISNELAEQVRRGAAGHTPETAAYGWGTSGWLFPDSAGGHLTPAWVGAIVANALPDGYTMHTLRHRFATRAYRGTATCAPCKPCSATRGSPPPSATPRSTTTKSAPPQQAPGEESGAATRRARM